MKRSGDIALGLILMLLIMLVIITLCAGVTCSGRNENWSTPYSTQYSYKQPNERIHIRGTITYISSPRYIYVRIGRTELPYDIIQTPLLDPQGKRVEKINKTLIGKKIVIEYGKVGEPFLRSMQLVDEADQQKIVLPPKDFAIMNVPTMNIVRDHSSMVRAARIGQTTD